MSELKVYLSGAVKIVDMNFQTWRDKCLKIEENGFYPDVKFVDPTIYFNYTDKQPVTDKQCLNLFMWLIEKSDVILINLDHCNVSIGSAIEVEHAYCNNIPIIGFGNIKGTWYNWIEERCSVVFDNLEDAIDYISLTYGSI